MAKLSIYDKIAALFQHKLLTKEEWGKDGFMILRFLSMKEEYLETVNIIQKHTALGYRIQPLLHALVDRADGAPFLEYIKKEGKEEYHLSEETIKILQKEFAVSKKRMREYLPNIWATDEEIKEAYGVE